MSLQERLKTKYPPRLAGVAHADTASGLFDLFRASVLLLVLALNALSCKDLGESPATAPVQVITVALRNTDTYLYPSVGGDEEGALITRQALHYRVSEIRRGPATNFVAVYVYQPQTGYVGSDEAEIELHTGSDGATPPTSTSRIIFRFSITN